MDRLTPTQTPPDRWQFANTDRALAILAAAGWMDVSAAPLDVILETRGAAAEAAASIGSMGPAARILDAKGATKTQVTVIAADIATVFRQFETEHGLQVPATMTLLSARAPV